MKNLKLSYSNRFLIGANWGVYSSIAGLHFLSNISLGIQFFQYPETSTRLTVICINRNIPFPSLTINDSSFLIHFCRFVLTSMHGSVRYFRFDFRRIVGFLFPYTASVKVPSHCLALSVYVQRFLDASRTTIRKRFLSLIS